MTKRPIRFVKNTCTRHAEGIYHDCAYVDFRDSLIPLAEAAADAEVPLESEGECVQTDRWDAAFHRAMKRLTSEPFTRASFEVPRVLQ